MSPGPMAHGPRAEPLGLGARLGLLGTDRMLRLIGDGTLKSYGGRNCKKKVTERKKLPRGRCLKGKCVFLRKKKAPAGTLVAKPDFLRKKKAPAGTLVAKPDFFEKKRPCGHAGDDSALF